MTEYSGDTTRGGAAGSPADGADRAWWGEPDPVEVFAAGLELALRQLRIEVAGLRAERDGLRLEVEGLRAKLVIAQEQLNAQSNLSDTVRQLQAAVARITLGQVGTTAAAPSPIVLPSLASVDLTPPPVATQPIPLAPVPPAVAPEPEPIALAPIVTPTPTPSPPPAEPSAIEQLKAMGVWPPKRTDPASPFAPAGDAVTFAPPRPAPASRPPVPEPEPVVEDRSVSQPPPEREPISELRDAVVNWDRSSTRRTPVAVDDERDRFDVPEAVPAKPKSTLRKVATGVGAVLGTMVVLTVLLVSVGPRFLPYQTYFVRSGSMEPTIQTGAMVVLTKVDGSQLEPGDIITFENPDNTSVLVTHRIVEVENTEQGRMFVTKGDANGDVDSWRVPASGTGWKYAFNVPIIGFVFGYLGTPQARLALLVVPAAILGLLALLDIWRPKEGAA